jgi:hypothetical protein
MFGETVPGHHIPVLNEREVREKTPIQRVGGLQWGGLGLFALGMFGVLQVMEGRNAGMNHHGPNHQIIQDLKGSMAPTDPHAQHRH